MKGIITLLSALLSVALMGLLGGCSTSGYRVVSHIHPVSVDGIRVDALMDTGATTTAIDARDIFADQSNGTVSFTFQGKKFIKKLIRTARIINHNSITVRWVTEMEVSALSLAESFTKKIEVSLMNRSKFPYPVLIGRNFLKHDFAVISRD